MIPIETAASKILFSQGLSQIILASQNQNRNLPTEAVRPLISVRLLLFDVIINKYSDLQT